MNQFYLSILVRIEQRVARIEQALQIEGEIMSDVDTRLAQLQSEVGDAATAIGSAADDVNRALADLKAALSGTLTADQAAKFDAVDASVAGLKNSAAAIQAAVDAADPEPVATEPVPAAGPTTVPVGDSGGTAAPAPAE